MILSLKRLLFSKASTSFCSFNYSFSEFYLYLVNFYSLNFPGFWELTFLRPILKSKGAFVFSFFSFVCHFCSTNLVYLQILKMILRSLCAYDPLQVVDFAWTWPTQSQTDVACYLLCFVRLTCGHDEVQTILGWNL